MVSPRPVYLQLMAAHAVQLSTFRCSSTENNGSASMHFPLTLMAIVQDQLESRLYPKRQHIIDSEGSKKTIVTNGFWRTHRGTLFLNTSIDTSVCNSSKRYKTQESGKSIF